MRRTISLALAILLLIGVSVRVNAPEKLREELLAPRHQELTRGQVIQRLVEAASMSPLEAERLVDEQSNELQFWEYVLPHSFGDGKVAEVGCIYLVLCNESNTKVEGVLATWTTAYSLSVHKGELAWVEFYKHVEHDSETVMLMARGAIEIRTPLGGATYYDRSVESWSKTLRHRGV